PAPEPTPEPACVAALAPPALHGAHPSLRSSDERIPIRSSPPTGGPMFSNRIHPFRPRLLDALKGYDRRRLLADLGAGITVGIVALPLAMAFAIASGVNPEQGLFTAIVAGLLISALGG